MIISIDNFFNVVNLIVRIGIVVYLIKRYVIGQVQKSIVLEKQDLQFLKEQQAQILQTCEKIEAQIVHDQKSFTTLQTKFKIWNQQEYLQAEQEKAVCLERQKNIEIAHLKKRKYLQHRTFMQLEVPSLLQNAHETLQQEFAKDQTLGKKYQAKVLQALEKLQ